MLHICHSYWGKGALTTNVMDECASHANNGRINQGATTMTQTQFIISRMQELDQWRLDGWITEADYQERMNYWRAILRGCES